MAMTPDRPPSNTPCDFEHPHADHPCGHRIISGVTTCRYCGNLDESPECEAAGCWQPATEADLDALKCEAMEFDAFTPLGWGVAVQRKEDQ